eukprot:1514602-Pleurochrysis_carterae.AAC.1
MKTACSTYSHTQLQLMDPLRTLHQVQHWPSLRFDLGVQNLGLRGTTLESKTEFTDSREAL